MAKPIRLVFSTPANGATNVPVNLRRITLAFNKNVVSDDVWDNNKQQVQLFRGSTRIPALIQRVPNDVNFALRGRIFVVPLVRPLRERTTYSVRVLTGLRSRAGDTLDNPVTVRFTTEQREE